MLLIDASLNGHGHVSASALEQERAAKHYTHPRYPDYRESPLCHLVLIEKLNTAINGCEWLHSLTSLPKDEASLYPTQVSSYLQGIVSYTCVGSTVIVETGGTRC